MTMKVRIAFVTGPDGNIDVGRIGAIEEYADEEAKQLIREGIGAEATEEEIAAWAVEQTRRDVAKVGGPVAATVDVTHEPDGGGESASGESVAELADPPATSRRR